MSRNTVIWIIVATFLVLVGCVLFGCVMSVLKWDFSKLSTHTYETNESIVEEDVQNISIICDTADISLLPSDDDRTKVVCYEVKNMKHSVKAEKDTLIIELVDCRKWFEHIGFGFDTPKITVYLPDIEYGSLSIKNSTGDTNIAENFTFEKIDVEESTGSVTNYASVEESMKITTTTGSIKVENLKSGSCDFSVTTGDINIADIECENDFTANVSTGKIDLSNIVCKNLNSDGGTGRISMNNVVSSGKITLIRSTGDISFDFCDANSMFIKTDTGDIKGSLLSEKIFSAQSSTGKVVVPKSTTGGVCEVSSNTGNINIGVNLN